MTEDRLELDHEFDLLINYDPNRWLEIPPRWDRESWQKADDWSRECAELLWQAFAQHPGKSGVAFLAGTLRCCADAFAPERFDTRVLLHIASPTALPLPLVASVEPASGARERTLRALVKADDPEAVEPPVVAAHHTKQLGDGLRAFRYVRQDDTSEVIAGITYAWRVHDVGADVTLWTATDDTGQIIRASQDIEELAHKLSVRVLDLEPESEASPGTAALRRRGLVADERGYRDA
ncbi:hypothetical protein [Streptomyces sp. P17]|uniref:hypothetical protein n=1 Tax=Streptomyces sp. P17 TaxID=3074716 RepID=UPI0028F428FF|nr:hypothetical protein [Streptomyces sp. P17]MDT9697170.1 hypothetical protein [Streptomyces sp. P17]